MIREYDAAADIPDDLTNVLAVVNTVLLGGPYVHADYHSVDLSTVPPENILEETNSLGGKTTTYFVPTRTLPLLEPLRDIGVPDELVDVVEKPVRAVVDSAYDRAPHENGGATVDNASATPISLDASLNIYFLRSGTTTTSQASVTGEPEKVTGDPQRVKKDSQPVKHDSTQRARIVMSGFVIRFVTGWKPGVPNARPSVPNERPSVLNARPNARLSARPRARPRRAATAVNRTSGRRVCSEFLPQRIPVGPTVKA